MATTAAAAAVIVLQTTLAGPSVGPQAPAQQAPACVYKQVLTIDAKGERRYDYRMVCERK